MIRSLSIEEGNVPIPPSLSRGRIHYVPEIRPGELFNSILIRALLHTGESLSLETYLKWDFEPAPFFQHVVVPPLVRYQKASSGVWGLDVDEVVANNCILPFVSPFVSRKLRERHLSWLVSEPITWRKSPIFPGSATVLPPAHFRVCPACLEQDRSAWGESYLHRTHHLPGIDFCLDHMLELIPIGNKHTNIKVLLSEMHRVSRMERVVVSYVPESLQLHLRTAVAALFSRPMQSTEELDFGTLYRYRMEQLGIGRKQWSSYLVERLNSVYRGEPARAFHFVSWVPFVAPYLNGYRDHLPAIAHMVIQDCLGISFEEAMKYADGRLWRCANPFSDCGMAVSAQHFCGQSTEHIKCLNCGFEAAIPRSSPLGSKPKIRLVISRGPVFEQGAREAMNHSTSLRELASKTGLSPRVWARILQDMGLRRGERRIRGKLSSAGRKSRLREKNRRALLDFLASNPGATRVRLNKELTGPYRWLLVNDKDWYLEHAPVRGSTKGRRHMLTQKRYEAHRKYFEARRAAK